jgi:NAD(P)-dependent dehydrogenase (short-subunit alcohol dehydrogenase family)
MTYHEVMSDPFSGAVAVVTGAASGIGAALVQSLAARGAVVVATDVNAARLASVAASVPGRVTTAVVDVSDADELTRLLEGVAAEQGRLDYVFNNAGIVAGGDFELTDEAVWQRIVDVNLWGVVNGTRAAYAVMLRQGSGHIVNTSSSAGVMPVSRSVAYATTKHAVMGLSTSLRAEAARKGVRVSVVLPGMVDTGIFDAAANAGDYDYARAVERVPFAKITPARAAEHILDGVAKNKQQIVFPFYNKVLCSLTRVMPTVMSRVINL